MSIENQRVLIGIATYNSIHVETTASLLNLYRNCKTPVQIRFTPYTYIHVARSSLLTKAIELNATHLMFIDSDMIFNSTDLDKLVAQDKDIIGGLYHKRVAPHSPVIYRQKGKELKVIKKIPKETFPVDVIGMGFTLIKMSVFKNMEPPFFYYANPQEFNLKPSTLFDLGEDTTFCLKARKTGHKIWCDPNVALTHIGQEFF